MIYDYSRRAVAGSRRWVWRTLVTGR